MGTPRVRPYPKRWGSTNPSVGEMVGASIMAIGTVIIFIMMLLYVLVG